MITPVVNTAKGFLKFSGVRWNYVLTDLSIIRPTGKVGVEDDADAGRMIDIQRSIRDNTEYTHIKLYKIWIFPSFAPREVEKRVHRLHRVFKTEKFKGSNGWTEWMAGPNWLSGFLMAWMCLHYDPPLVLTVPALLFTLFGPFPTDLIISVTWVGLTQLFASSVFFLIIFSAIAYFFIL